MLQTSSSSPCVASRRPYPWASQASICLGPPFAVIVAGHPYAYRLFHRLVGHFESSPLCSGRLSGDHRGAGVVNDHDSLVGLDHVCRRRLLTACLSIGTRHFPSVPFAQASASVTESCRPSLLAAVGSECTSKVDSENRC